MMFIYMTKILIFLYFFTNFSLFLFFLYLLKGWDNDWEITIHQWFKRWETREQYMTGINHFNIDSYISRLLDF